MSTKSIVPRNNQEGSIGTNLKRWGAGHFSTLFVDGSAVSTIAFVSTAIANLVASSPSTLDTLNELATALGNDPNFATTITTLIGTKESAILAGTTSQYWRGDKTWQTHNIASLSDANNVALLNAANVFTASQTITAPVGAKALIINGGTQTLNFPIIDGSQTWNNVSVAFTPIKLNVTDTASSASSLLIDLQVASTSKFKVDKSGNLYLSNSTYPISAGSYYVWLGGGGGFSFQNGPGGLTIARSSPLGWDSAGQPTSNSQTLQLWQDANDALAQRRGTNPQTFNIYHTYTSGSVYERGYLKANSGGSFEIGTEQIGASNRSLLLKSATSIIQIGGTTSSYPALKNNGSLLEFVRANNSQLTAIRFGVAWDNNNQTCINPLNRVLVTSANHTTVDWQNQRLYCYGYREVVDWENQFLRDFVGTRSVYWAARRLTDSSDNIAVEWQNRQLVNSVGQATIAWNSGNISSGGLDSINWANRILFDSSGLPSVDWTARRLYQSDGATVALDWSNGVSLGGTVPSVNFSTNIDWSTSQTFYETLAGDTNISFTNSTDGKTISAYIDLQGFIPTFTDTITWPGGSAPTVPASGKILYTFININGEIICAYIKYITGGNPTYILINDSNTGQVLVSGGHYAADTTSAVFTILLPASPNIGDTIVVADAQSTWKINPLTIDNNGNNLDGAMSVIDFNVSNMNYSLIYVGGVKGWSVYA